MVVVGGGGGGGGGVMVVDVIIDIGIFPSRIRICYHNTIQGT